MTSVRTGRKSCKTAKPFDVVNWLTADDTLDTIKTFAEKYTAFSRIDSDDVTSEIVLALLERQYEAPTTEAEFLTWVEEVVAPEVGKRMLAAERRIERHEKHVTAGSDDTNIVELVAEETPDDGEPKFQFCHELVAHERKRAARIRRALSKLSDGQRQAIMDKFFAGKSLAGVAADSEMCDSSHRMRLLRGKNKLAAMIDREGYSVAA